MFGRCGMVPLPMALPVADGCGGLLYRSWVSPRQPDGCGIPAPAAGDALKPDQLVLLLVPALAVDTGIRLGYGGGYYDRLRADPAWPLFQPGLSCPQPALRPRRCPASPGMFRSPAGSRNRVLVGPPEGPHHGHH